MTSCAWLWIYAGAVLVALELVLPGFILCFFGLSAATVGAIRFATGDAFGPAWQAAAFSFFSVLYIAVLRRYMKKVFVGVSDASKADFDNDFTGRTAVVTAAISPPDTGRAMLGDAEWTASARSPIEAGRKVRVAGRRNLTLEVEELSAADGPQPAVKNSNGGSLP